MNTVFLLLSIYNKPFLNFTETCEAIGISKQSGYNMRTNHTFPIAMMEGPLRASVQDIATYIDQQRELAQEKVKV